MLPRRSRSLAVLGLLVCGSLTSCALVADVLGGSPEVLDTGVEPVPLDLEAPTYAVVTRKGLLVRSGDGKRVVPSVSSVSWLPNGTALVLRSKGRKTRLQLVDPAEEQAGAWLPASSMPSRAATAVGTVTTQTDPRDPPSELVTYSLDLVEKVRQELPPIDGSAGEEGDLLYRGYHGAVATIDGATFVQWDDNSEDDEEYRGDHGIARVEDGEVQDVAVNERVVALYLSVDGSGLLALRQVDGDPCGGCNVDQEIAEVDPATGELTTYGMPEEYDERWRVAAMDKVGDRVAVRFVHDDVTGDQTLPLVGTYVYEDGSWTLLEGSDEEITWWQGKDRVVLREPDREDGGDLYWLHGEEETELPGRVRGRIDGGLVELAVAGQLLPPP